MASTNAPPQYSESSRDSVQIVDAQSAETSVHGREQTGLLGPTKADSSKVRVASSTATVNAAEYSHPQCCMCMWFVYMYAHKRVCKGQRGPSGGVPGPMGDTLAERREK